VAHIRGMTRRSRLIDGVYEAQRSGYLPGEPARTFSLLSICDDCAGVGRVFSCDDLLVEAGPKSSFVCFFLAARRARLFEGDIILLVASPSQQSIK
jgi:hypothetical protein